MYLTKQLVHQIDTKNKWIDIVDYDQFSHRSNLVGFNYIIVEVFNRKIIPMYPEKKTFSNEFAYKQTCKAITWDVSHRDIEKQRASGARGLTYLIVISISNKNRGKKTIIEKPFWNEEYGGFDYTGKVTTTTKKTEKELEPKWEYVVKGCRLISDEDKNRIKEYYYDYIYDRIQTLHHVELDWFFVDYGLNSNKVLRNSIR